MISTDFPEEYFVPDPKKQSIYNYKVDGGTNIAKDKTIIFCGICRNVGDTLEQNILRIHRTGALFKDYHIFIYENDSIDNTVEILHKHKSDKLNFVSTTRPDNDYRKDLDNGVDPWHYNRCRILADCRNYYLEYARSLKNIDYLCPLDLDLRGGWSYDGIKHGIYTLENYPKCACVSSYGVLSDPDNIFPLELVDIKELIMYDSFAFRPPGQDKVHILRTPMFNLLQFDRGDDPIEVNSNFGGMAIYKMANIKDYKYTAKCWNEGCVDPDHVTLNRLIRKDGFNIVLDPNMIVSYSHHKYSDDKHILTS